MKRSRERFRREVTICISGAQAIMSVWCINVVLCLSFVSIALWFERANDHSVP